MECFHSESSLAELSLLVPALLDILRLGFTGRAVDFLVAGGGCTEIVDFRLRFQEPELAASEGSS